VDNVVPRIRQLAERRRPFSAMSYFRNMNESLKTPNARDITVSHLATINIYHHVMDMKLSQKLILRKASCYF